MICSSENLVRFIVRPQVGSDSNRWWRKNPVAGQRPSTWLENVFPLCAVEFSAELTDINDIRSSEDQNPTTACDAQYFGAWNEAALGVFSSVRTLACRLAAGLWPGDFCICIASCLASSVAASESISQ